MLQLLDLAERVISQRLVQRCVAVFVGDVQIRATSHQQLIGQAGREIKKRLKF